MFCRIGEEQHKNHHLSPLYSTSGKSAEHLCYYTIYLFIIWKCLEGIETVPEESPAELTEEDFQQLKKVNKTVIKNLFKYFLTLLVS